MSLGCTIVAKCFAYVSVFDPTIEERPSQDRQMVFVEVEKKVETPFTTDNLVATNKNLLGR